MRALKVIICYIVIALDSSAQDIVPISISVDQYNVYQYIHRSTRRVVSRYLYDQASPFSEGLARVSRNGLFGYIDTSGREVIPCRYIHARDVTDGLAVVSIGETEITEKYISVRNERYGALNTKGIRVIPFIFSEILGFKNGLSVAKSFENQKWGWIDRLGEWVILPKFKSVKDFNDWGLAKVSISDSQEIEEKYGYIDRSGKYVIPADYSELGDIHDGMIKMRKRQQGGIYKFGFFNTKGIVIVPCKYDYASDYQAGRAIIGKKSITDRYKYGYIDQLGTQITNIHFDEAKKFYYDLAMVNLNGKYGWIDRNGQFVIANRYDFSYPFSGINDKTSEITEKISFNKSSLDKSISALVSKDGYWGAIDRQGNEIINVKYENIEKSEIGYSALYRNRIIYLNIDGREITDTLSMVDTTVIHSNMHSDIPDISDFKNYQKMGYQLSDLTLNNQKAAFGKTYILTRYDCDNIFLKENSGKFGLADSMGKIKIKPIYDSIKCLADGYYDCRYLLVGYRNNILDMILFDSLCHPYTVQTNYQYIEKKRFFTHNEYWKVRKDGKWGLVHIGIRGLQVILDCAYDDIGYPGKLSKGENEKNILIPVKVKSNWRVYSLLTRSFVSDDSFDDIAFAGSEMSVCFAKIQGLWGIYDNSLNMVVPHKYEDVRLDLEYDRCDIFSVKENGKWGLVTEKGEFIMKNIFDDLIYLCHQSDAVGRINKKIVFIDNIW